MAALTWLRPTKSVRERKISRRLQSYFGPIQDNAVLYFPERIERRSFANLCHRRCDSAIESQDQDAIDGTRHVHLLACSKAVSMCCVTVASTDRKCGNVQYVGGARNFFNYGWPGTTQQIAPSEA
jgi:hypothetical protein